MGAFNNSGLPFHFKDIFGVFDNRCEFQVEFEFGIHVELSREMGFGFEWQFIVY